MSLFEACKDIKYWLSKRLYANEQHVRFSLVGRILHELGWDVWNPEIFNTEYTIIVPDNSDNRHGTTRTYKVDIALCKKSRKGMEPHILIEVKGVGMNAQQATNGRNQLELYSSKFDSISILTDGCTWEFYLNSLKKINTSFESCLISKVNLSEDSIDDICDVFQKLLNPEKTTKQLDKTGRIMHRVFVVENYINEALPEAKLTGHNVSMRSQDVFTIIKSGHRQERLSQLEFSKVLKEMVDKGKLDLDGTPPLSELLFHLKTKDIQAYCFYDYNQKKYIVTKGSEVRLTKTEANEDIMLDGREQLIASGVVRHDKKTGKCILTKDCVFDTPSGASVFVLGRSSNGWEEWLDDKNQPLKTYRQSLDN
jgi:hypothetical protein